MFAFRHRGRTVARLLLAVVALSMAWGAEAGARGAETTALTVDEQAVTQPEFRWFMELERPGVLARLRGAPELAGKSVRAALQSNTVARVVREKTEQSLFRELGLLPDTGYSAFLDALGATNREREEATRDGRAVYGPVQYTQLQFYEHRKATLRAKAIELFAEKRWAPAEAELRRYYDQNRALFRAAPTYTVEVVTIQPAGKPAAGASAETVRAAAESIQSKLAAGTDLRAVLNDQPEGGVVTVAGQRFTEINADRLGEMFPDEQALKRVEGLAPGQTTTVVGSDVRIRIVQCVTKTAGSDRPFAVVQTQVKERWAAQQYQRELDKRAARARVKINQEVVDALLR